MDSKKYSLSQIIVIRLMTAALICLFMTFISCQGADDAGPENVSVSEEAALESPAEEETKAEDAQEAEEEIGAEEDRKAEEVPVDTTEAHGDISIYDSCLLAHRLYGGVYRLPYSTELIYDVEYEGQKYRVQPDCSGCINFGLTLAGLIDPSMPCAMDHDQDLSGYGLTRIDASELDLPSDLEKGDLLVYSDHIEMFCKEGIESGREDIEDIDQRPLVISYGDNACGLERYNGAKDVFATDPSIVSYYWYSDIEHIWRYE